ncbi:hypothetical protein [Hyphomicrobium sp. CS1BSMeth3]|uniref:hypothetical protein n=1 Tax=Hyphomicrobium sp. CS1BSMeth3 TaxID=1892844 RepID=UPI0009312B05|nr:hypothetical protein [Hyphomicrobium sp. CS1BSMeth3]
MSSKPEAVVKVCQQCQEEKPAAAFFPSPLHADGFTDRCKRCVFERSRQEQARREKRAQHEAAPLQGSR